MTSPEKPPGPFTLLFDPVRFILARTASPPSLLGASGVFLLFIVPSMIAYISLASKVMSALPDYIEPDMVKSFISVFTLTVISQGIAGVILWVVGTGMLTCLSIIFDGDAEYRKLLELTGFSFLPLALSSLGMMLYILPHDLAIGFHLERGMSEAAISREISDSIHAAVSTTGFKLIGAFNATAMAWTGVLMVLALRHAGKLSLGKSILSLGVITIFFLIVLYLRHTINPGSM